MKKNILLFAVLMVLLVTVFGCASNKEVKVVGADGSPRPEWVKEMGKLDKKLHYEVGYGKLSNYATSLKRAEADGRNKIAMWVKADVKTVLKTYTQDSGIAEERELIEYMEEVSQQTANLSLSGAQVVEIWESAANEVYVLMSYDIDQAAKNLESQMKTYQRNESAAFAEFKAQEAFKQLQAQQTANNAGSLL